MAGPESGLGQGEFLLWMQRFRQGFRQLSDHLALSLLALALVACVGPEEPDDGLIDNVPSLVNTKQAFIFALRGDDYSFEENYSLNLLTQLGDTLVTTLVASGLTGKDTLTIVLFTETDSTLSNYALTRDLVRVETRVLGNADHPRKAYFNAVHFNGVVEYVLAHQKN